MLRMRGDLQPKFQTRTVGKGQKIHLVRKRFVTPALVRLEGRVHGLAGSVNRIQDKLQVHEMDLKKSPATKVNISFKLPVAY